MNGAPSISQRRVHHVILDRDGVLNVEASGRGYLEQWSQWRWVKGAREALAALHRAGVHVSIATNQSAIGRGRVTQTAVDAIHARMREAAAEAGGAIEHVWVCPHSPADGCDCRKPSPGLLLRAVQAAGVAPDATLAVGDDLRDLEAAWAAGIRPVLVRTGKGRATEAMLPPGRVAVFDDLRAFVVALLANAVPVVAPAS